MTGRRSCGPSYVSLPLSIFSMLVASCGSTTSYQPLNRSPRAMTPRAPSSVEVFMLKMPTQPFVEVGLIHTEQSSDVSIVSPAQLAGQLRQRAAQIGCDGVVMQAADAQYGGGLALSSYTSRAFRAACIMWKQGAASRPSLTDGERCSERDADACLREALSVESAAGKMHFWLKACEMKLPRACTQAGYGYYQGDGVTKNDGLAESLLLTACDARDALACRYLGVMLVDRKTDLPKGVQKLQLACDDRDAWSCWKLGSIYASNVLGKENDEQAAVFYRRACKLGYDAGCNSLK